MSCDVYMKIDGIDGDSTDEKHKNWIELLGFSNGLSQMGGGSSSAAGAHSGGKIDISEFNVTFTMCSASPTIAKFICLGKHVPKIEIELCRATGDKQVFMKYTLQDAFFTSYQQSGGTGSLPTESLGIRFGQIHWVYTPTDVKGKALAAKKAGWSTEENKEVTPA